ncbi:MarR family winged helix-turn-helix transcriptional regulator [Streptomyces noursei]|uniref:MarR family winged helix-turn-helix transcriptional regulator n=1 Tax=Streptomyces noursei TaxID=1971 RepID=UPI00380F903E
MELQHGQGVVAGNHHPGHRPADSLHPLLVRAQEAGEVRDDLTEASNVSTIVRGLVGRGLLAREPDPADRRAVRLQPTAQSVADLRMIERNWAESFADTLATLTDDQRAALTAALPALRALAAAGQETSTAPGE